MTAATSSMPLADRLDHGPWGGLQKGVLTLCALAFAVDGLANQVLPLSIPALGHDWGLARPAFASIAAAGLLGVAAGTVAGGLAGDRFGRRLGLIGSVLFFGLWTALTARVNGPDALLWMRALAGLGIGGAIPNGTALITEYTPLRRRGLAIAIGMMFIPAGGLISGLIGAYVLPTLGWRGLFLATGALPLALGLVLMLALPESPRFLARAAGGGAGLERLAHRLGCRDGRMPEEARAAGSMAGLFGAAVRRDTLLLWAAFFFCFLANYSLLSWIPSLLAGEGFDLRATSLGMTAVNVGGVAGGLLGGWMIDRLGSKAAIVSIAAAGLAGALALGASAFSPAGGLAGPILMLATEGVFISGLQNGVYTMAAHLYPPHVRGAGVGAAAGAGRIGAVLSAYAGVLAIQLGGQRSYFIVIAAAVGACLVAVALIGGHLRAARLASATA